MTMNMSKLISNILLILAAIMTFVSISTFQNGGSPTLLFITIWLISYAHNIIVAEVDMSARLATTKLSLWEKRLLFPFQPNLFTRKTILAQRIWSYFTILVITVSIIMWEQAILGLGVLIQIPLYIILAFTCDLHTRKSVGYGRDEIKAKARKEKDRQKRKRERERRR